MPSDVKYISNLYWPFFISAARCAFWDTSMNEWSFDGCSLTEHNAEYTRCVCNHLTNFAVIMDVNGNLDDIDDVSSDDKN